MKHDAAFSKFMRAVGEHILPCARFPHGSEKIALYNHHDTSDSDHFVIAYTNDQQTMTNFVYPDIHQGPLAFDVRGIRMLLLIP